MGLSRSEDKENDAQGISFRQKEFLNNLLVKEVNNRLSSLFQVDNQRSNIVSRFFVVFHMCPITFRKLNQRK